VLGARTPWLVAVALVAWLGALLALDHGASLGEQLALGGATFALLIALSIPLTAERRTQVAIVVAVASCFEVLGSIIWGVYRYRLGNLPLFVPPAHGIVYLTGLALSRTPLFTRRPQLLVRGALVGAVTWGVLGLTVLSRVDVIGAFGVVVFSCFLLRGRNPQVLAGVFFVVAALEWYGTALGTWRWAPVVPGLGLGDGNPPSGAVSGYVLFDLVAFWAGPLLLGAVRATLMRPRSPLLERS
jgi:hypothetical protein